MKEQALREILEQTMGFGLHGLLMSFPLSESHNSFIITRIRTWWPVTLQMMGRDV